MHQIKTPALNTFNILRTRFLCFVLILVSTQTIYGQKSSRDSLEIVLKEVKAQTDFNVQDTVHINLLNALGSELRYYKTDSLLLLSGQALNYSRLANYKKGECKALLGIGNYYSDKGEHTKGISYYKKALTLAKEIENSTLILRIHNNLAGEYEYKGNYAEALNGYLKCIEIATKVDDQHMLSIINENIANLYASQKDYRQALDFFKTVKKINDKIGNNVYSAETMSNMASVYADMGELEYAMFNINSSISTFEKHEIMDWLAFAYEVKGKAYLKDNKFKWALYWYKQSEKLHSNLEDDRGKIDLMNGMAEVHLALQRDSISKDYALRAFDISKKLQFKEGMQKCALTLYKVYKNKKDFDTALEYHELYQSLSDTLSRNENKKSLTMLKTKIEHEKQKENLINQNEMALAKQKNYVNAALCILLVFLVVTFLMRRSERIQKRLNIELYNKTSELVKNERELRDINETKDKLFSIIGHDLRGPIGAFQGLVKLYKDKEIGKEEFLDFIPKLGADIDHISFTLNNLLSWGQTQMNGSVTKPTIVSLENIVDDNINLLTEIATSKSINMVNKLSENTLVWSDSDQIDIVLRNLISNALKFTPNKGLITINAVERANNWEISVRDTGVGMDRETINKIFSENANITTYGTNNEKGTGLGLSLCKEMVEKNGGAIWVESILNRGTSFYFTVPRATPPKNYQRAS
ncbi:MAG: tetratricopeptide repeat-containing sensor histidine kinase [Maribacter sp.]|nr:tetratricopeptide repeat-containing sensor histidine kinase [Maribacter sp.]